MNEQLLLLEEINIQQLCRMLP